MTAIKGIGRRYAHAVLRKADIDIRKRAGELSEEEVSLFSYLIRDVAATLGETKSFITIK